MGLSQDLKDALVTVCREALSLGLFAARPDLGPAEILAEFVEAAIDEGWKDNAATLEANRAEAEKIIAGVIGFM